MNIKVKKRLDNFFSQYRLYKFKKGEVLINAEENPPEVFYLTSGIVKRYAVTEDGDELTLNIYRPISFFPVSNAINNSLNHHFYEALTPVEVWAAPKEKVLEFLKNEPEVVFDLLGRIYKGLDGFFLRMEKLMGSGAEAKLMTELLIAAKRFGISNNQATVINLKLTEKDLAAQTGIARETVSRQLNKLKRKGLIEYKNKRLQINDLGKLEEELSKNCD